MPVDIDPLELAGTDDDDDVPITAAAGEAERQRDAKAKSQLNGMVAVTIALLATFIAICNVKDGNIVQAMQQAQADKIDQWNFYQARNIREEVGKGVLAELSVLQSTAPAGPARAAFDSTLARYRAFVKDEDEKKQKVRADAEGAQKQYDALNIHDDQFDLSEALLSLTVSLLAVTSLTGKRWLYFFALVPMFFGVLMGLAGLFGWSLHSDLAARLLS